MLISDWSPYVCSSYLGGAQRFAAGRRFLRIVLERRHVEAHLFRILRIEQSQRLKDRRKASEALVGPLDDLFGDRSAFEVVGFQQRRRRLALDDMRELPGDRKSTRLNSSH